MPILLPVIALAGTPVWTDRVERLLHEHQFGPVRYITPANLFERLIEEYPAMLIVNGDHADWMSWLTTIKTDQATRRIPVLVIFQDQTRLHDALTAGAATSLMLGELDQKLIPQIRAHGRLPDPALLEELVCQCQADLPPLARLGVERFNARDYYAQHDAFEQQWMQESGPVRDLYRAILQVGVAYYHLTRGNYVGGLRMINRSAQWFWMLPDVCQGIDVRQLREDAARIRTVLRASDPVNPSDFDLTLLKPLHLVEN